MNERLRLFLLLGDAVIITDAHHRILAVNETYERITGYAAHEIIGMRAGVLRSNQTPKKTYDEMKLALAAKQPWSGIFINRMKSRELWYSSITITPIEIGDTMYYVGVFRNLNQLSDGSYISEKRKINIQSEMLRVLAISCEIRDPLIEVHLKSVQRLTERLLVKLNERREPQLSDEYIHAVVNASILHDIGKSGIPEGILYKPGPLTYYERRIIEAHPLIGVDILDKINGELQDELLHQELSAARNIIACHHERWDGNGYPHGLSGKQIPLEARVVSIVDVYDALTSRRSYKEPWNRRKAADYISGESGKSFDPDLVDAFLALCDTDEADCPGQADAEREAESLQPAGANS